MQRSTAWRLRSVSGSIRCLLPHLCWIRVSEVPVVRADRLRLFLSLIAHVIDISKATISRWIVLAVCMTYDRLSPRDLPFMKSNAHEVRAVSATWAYYNYTSLGMSCRLPFGEQKRRLRLSILDPYSNRLETCIN